MSHDANLPPSPHPTQVLCYLDRTNLAYAALQLNERLGFSEVRVGMGEREREGRTFLTARASKHNRFPTHSTPFTTQSVYARGASIFFVSYASAQIPSNLALQRVGPARWLPALVIAWGLAAVAFSAMRTSTHFYALRVALGLAEAGVFPGMWAVLARFYGPSDLALAYTRASLGTVVAQAIGAPLAAALLSLDGFAGLDGWRILFLAEGVPTLVLGVLLARSLPDGPSDARSLTPDERVMVAARTVAPPLAKAGDHKPQADVEKGAKKAGGGGAASVSSVWAGVVAAAATPKTFHVAAVVALEAAAKNAIIYWSPLVIANAVVATVQQRGAGASLSVATTTTHAFRRLHSAAAAPPPLPGCGRPHRRPPVRRPLWRGRAGHVVLRAARQARAPGGAHTRGSTVRRSLPGPAPGLDVHRQGARPRLCRPAHRGGGAVGAVGGHVRVARNFPWRRSRSRRRRRPHQLPGQRGGRHGAPAGGQSESTHRGACRKPGRAGRVGWRCIDRGVPVVCRARPSRHRAGVVRVGRVAQAEGGSVAVAIQQRGGSVARESAGSAAVMGGAGVKWCSFVLVEQEKRS